MESCARLSVSLEGPGLFAMTSSPLPARKRDLTADDDDDDIDEDDYNNDEDDDDHHEVDDNDEDNDNNHFNDYLQQAHHLGQQAENDAEDFANELDISHNGSGACGGGGADGYNENVENQSYKANFRSGLTSTTNSVKVRKLKCRSTVSSNDASRSGTSVERDDITFTDSQDDIDDEMNNVVKRRYKQNKKKSTINNTAQIRAQQQQQRRFRSSATTTSSAVVTTSSNIKNSELKTSDYLTNDYEYIAKPPTTTAATTASTQTLKALAVNTVADSMVQQKSRVCSRCKRGIRHSSSCSSSTASGGGGGVVVDSSGMTMDELRAVNRYAESTKSLSYLPQVRDEYLLASRISV